MIRETKVGIFVFLSIILLLGMSMFFDGANPFSGKHINVTFYVSDAAGIVPSSNIMYMGIEVGKVKKVSIKNGFVAIESTITKEYKIPDNVVVSITQGGIIGVKYVDLTHKSKVQATGILVDGGEYYNFKPPISMDDLSEKIDNIAGQVTIFTEALNSTFSSEEGQANLRAIIHNLQVSTGSLKNILVNNEDDFHRIVKNLDNLTTVLDRASAGRDQELAQMIEDLAATSANLRRFSESIDTLMRSEHDDIASSIGNIKELTDSVKVSVNNLNSITNDIANGKGTLGMLITDNDTKQQVKDMLKTIHNATEAADKLVLEVEGSYENFARYGDNHGRFDIRIRPNASKYYLLGVSNYPVGNTRTTNEEYTKTDPNDSNNNEHYFTKTEKTYVNPLVFSLQYALVFRDFITLRAGVFENQLGFGMDVQPFKDHKLYFTFEASNFFRDKYGTYGKLNAKYYFTDNFFLQTGWNDFLSSRSSFSAGAGITLIDNDMKYLIGSIPSAASSFK